MKTESIKKEELLAMLTEIHDQLEELEIVLESNISSLRQNWNEDHSAKVTICGERLAALEAGGSHLLELGENNNKNSNPVQSMKLELGF